MPGGTALWVVAAIASAVVAVLAIPVRLEYSARFETALDWFVSVRWGTFRFRRSSAVRAAAEHPPAPDKHAPPRRRAPRGRAAVWRPLLRDRVFRRRAWRALRSLLARVESRRFAAACAFGCDDPADTGRLYGAIVPWVTALGAASDVSVSPIFTGPRFTASFAGEIRVVPLALIGPLVALGALALRLRRRRPRRAR